MKSPSPVHGTAAFHVPRERMLVVADLHMGIEREMALRGIHLPSRTRQFAEELAALATITKSKRLVFAGDVRHNIPLASFRERRELPLFFSAMLDAYGEVDIVKGNHDALIEELAPKGIAVHGSTGMRAGDVGICHGHSWPSKKVMSAPLLLVAHSHPVVTFRDGLGRAWSERCWLRAPFSGGKRYPRAKGEIVLMPAYNSYCGGSPVNVEDEPILGPLFRQGIVDLKDATVYMLDGTALGRRVDLMATQRS